jgi:ribosomal protein L11 methylase PrmA
MLQPNPGSFRDPGSRVFEMDGRIFRAIGSSSYENYRSAADTGVLQRLVERGFFVSSEERQSDLLPLAQSPAALLEHERLPFISYPYEWPFALLKRAALFHLDLHLAALEEGFTLSDATAYNVQFRGTRPIGIDQLSLTPYKEGEIWAGHRQFCMQFLNPLILWSRKGVSPNAWFRGGLEGIAPEDLAPLMTMRDRFSWTILSHVVAQASFQKRAVATDRTIAHDKRPKLSKTAFKGMLVGLRSFIDDCRRPVSPTVWQEYAEDNSYENLEREAKRRFVSEMVTKTCPGLLFDLGCNSGDYSEAALRSGAGYVVGFDFDFGALEAAVERADRGLDFLPLWLDAANPSPSQGWGQAERPGLAQRATADALIALAFIHHIVIGRNVPMDMAVEWICSLAPTGIIEFPPKSDPMVQRLLANRPDIFPDYSEEGFINALQQRARVVSRAEVSKSGRILVWYERH